LPHSVNFAPQYREPVSGMESIARNLRAEAPLFGRALEEIFRMHHNSLPILRVTAIAGVFACTSVFAALAQSSAKTDCEVAAPAKSPTETAKGPDSGTKNMGSTGWSGGGMGGSRNDTTDAGPLPGSKSEHPATAKGLDPTKPDTTARKPC
jgi:hypothetical protein